MSFVTLREAIKGALESAMPAVKAYTHGGRFDVEELKRYSVNAPCLVVAPLGVKELYSDGGQVVAPFQWGCYVIAKDTPGAKRDTGALALLLRALAVIHPEQCWDDDDAQNPDEIKSTNLYSKALDALGIALWAITWTQKVDINALDLSALDAFLTIYATTKQSDDTSVPRSEDLVTLPQS